MANERRTEYFTLKLELDDKTEYRDYKKNRYSGYIRSIRVGRASSPNAVFKIRLKEGDEISLWPGRIVNFTERSEGATFSWDSLPQEWAEIEISESSYFVGGDYQTSSSSSGGSTAKEVRKSNYDLVRYYHPTTFEQIFETKKVLSQNDKRLYAIIENPNPEAIFVGSETNINKSISSLIRRKTSIRIMPFSKKRVDITGELFAIRDNAFQLTQGEVHNITVEEYLK